MLILRIKRSWVDILHLFQLSDKIVSGLVFEVAVVKPGNEPVIVFVFNMFHHKVNRAEGLLTNHAYVFLTFDNFATLVNAILILHLDKQLVLLRIRQFFSRALFEELFSLSHIVLFKLLCGPVKG
jgi:hypothetical protein